MSLVTEKVIFSREYWNGHSRDGAIVNGDGYHYYKMSPEGLIFEAYEVYEKEDGEEVVSPLPEMILVDWCRDLGFEDFEVLDLISEYEFDRIRNTIRSVA